MSPPYYEVKDRFELIWSDPLDDPITAILKQWSIAAIPAPIQWLPYHSVNEKVSVECLSLIHPYQPPALLALSTSAKTETTAETTAPLVKNNYQISAVPKPRYISNHAQDFDNQRCLNSILALSQAEVKAFVRIVILNNKRFFSTALNSQEQYAYHKRFLETLLRDKTLTNYPNLIITNLNSPEIVALRRSQSQVPIVTASPLPQRRSTLIAAEEAKKSISSANDATTNASDAVDAAEGTQGAEAKETAEEPTESEEVGDLPNLFKTLFSPFQQLLFQFSTLYQLLEDWKRQLFGRDYLLCLPLQFKTLGTSLNDLYYISEEDVESMLWNWTDYEGNAAAKYAYPNRRSSELDLASLLIEDVPRLTTHPVQIPLFVIDSIYRSNEYERTSLLSEKRLAMPKKKVNLSQIKSKRAQKKKQEEEMRLMKIILAEIEAITQRQIADGYLLLQIQTVKIYTEVMRTMKVKKPQSLLTNQEEAEETRGVKGESGENNKNNNNPGDGIVSAINNTSNTNNPAEGESLAAGENDLLRREEEKEEVIEVKETVVDVITNVRVHIIGDKLTLQRQFELEHPETVSDGLQTSDPSNPLKIVNSAFEEAYQLQRFDFLQLPDWFLTLFSQDEGSFIEDEVWFVMKQHTKVSQLQETFEQILEALRRKDHAPSSSTLLTDRQQKNQSKNKKGGEEQGLELDFRQFYRQLVHEYEMSRLYELSLPEDLREIDFSLAGNLSIFFKDFLMQLWYARPSQTIMSLEKTDDPSTAANHTSNTNTNNNDNDDDQETAGDLTREASAAAAGSTRSHSNSNSNKNKNSRRRRRSSRRDGFVISAAMRHYMFNLSDDFIRSFCFSKAFHRIIFDHLLRPDEEDDDDEEYEGQAMVRRERRGFQSQEELMDYLESNKNAFNNFFHHSVENLQSIFASRQLMMKAVVYALYYAMVMRMARTLALNEKYAYLFQRKDRMTRFIETIQRIERKLFLQKLEEDRELLALDAAGRVLEMVESIATNARQRRINEEKRREKEKEEAARRAAEAEAQAEGTISNNEEGKEEEENKQFLAFLTPEEEAIFEERFEQLYEELFHQELAKIEYIPEDYDKIVNEDGRGLSLEQVEEELFLTQLVPRLGQRRQTSGDKNTARAVENLVNQERQRLQQEQEQEKEKRNNLQKMTTEELHDYELTLFQEISEQQVKDLHAYRNKVLLEGLPILLERIIDLVLVDGIDQLTSQLIEENMIFPNYELNPENRRLKASVHVRRMTKQRQLQRRKYGKRITFLQFK